MRARISSKSNPPVCTGCGSGGLRARWSFRLALALLRSSLAFTTVACGSVSPSGRAGRSFSCWRSSSAVGPVRSLRPCRLGSTGGSSQLRSAMRARISSKSNPPVCTCCGSGGLRARWSVRLASALLRSSLAFTTVACGSVSPSGRAGRSFSCRLSSSAVGPVRSIRPCRLGSTWGSSQLRSAMRARISSKSNPPVCTCCGSGGLRARWSVRLASALLRSSLAFTTVACGSVSPSGGAGRSFSCRLSSSAVGPVRSTGSGWLSRSWKASLACWARLACRECPGAGSWGCLAINSRARSRFPCASSASFFAAAASTIRRLHSAWAALTSSASNPTCRAT